MTIKQITRRTIFMLLLFSWTSPAFTQGTAVIYGTVYDSTGALLPGVQVVARNTSTNGQRASVTGEEGSFVISNLPVGNYELSATLPGFKRHVEQNIRLQVDENRRVNVTLQIGEIAESVTVSSEVTQVDARSGTLKEVVDSARITGLPLDGRNVLQLQRLVPGSGGITGQGQAQNSSVSINGSRTNSNNYLLDGADNHDPYFNTPAVFPNPDALQEFSIQTSSYSAASGRNAGAMMNAVTRSGTNEFHGTLFEFVRNEKFNARNFFAVETPPFKRNQFGGTVGGRILRDKTFFFFAYQGWRERSAPGSRTATVPTQEQRAGDLSGLGKQIVDPRTGEPFPGNIIPSERLHPAVQDFLQAMVPLPNRPDGLLSFSSGQRFDQDQIIVKIDHNLSGSNTLTGRLLWNKDVFQEATGNLPNFFAAIDYDNWNLTVSDTQVFSSTLLNVFRFTFNDIDRLQSTIVPGEKTWADFGAGFTRTFTAEAAPGWNTNVVGYFQAFSRFPLNHFRQNYKFSNDLTWTRGAHQLQFGGAVTRSILDLQEFFLGDPLVRFRSTFTGDALGDLLLGRPDLVRQIAEDSNNPRTVELAFFLQDAWKVSRRLTLNLGVRWEPYFPFTDTEDRFGQFRPGVQSTVFPTAPTGAVFPGDAGIGRSMLEKSWANLGPRFGFAFDPFGTGTTSIRGGYGIFYSQIRQQAHNQISTNQPFSLKLDIINPPQGLDNPYSETGNPFPFSPPTGEEARNYQFVTPLQITMWDPDFRNAVVQQWNLNLQQQLLEGWISTIAYVGSKGNHLFMSYELNPALPGKGSVNARRIYAPNFASINNYAAVGNSTYHSMQLSMNKRFTGGFSLLASHTWSKLIDNASADGDQPSNPFKISDEKGLSDLDIAHRFVASFILDLPEFQGFSGIVRHLLGGWQMNGILALQSGRPFSVVSGKDNSKSGVNNDRADLVGDPELDAGRSRHELIQKYFSTDAFAPNPAGTFGTSGRNILRGPGDANVDLAMIKHIPLWRENHRIEFRAEFFNLFNRVNFGNPNGNLSAGNFGKITSAGTPRVLQFGLKYQF